MPPSLLLRGEAINWLNKYGAERHIFVSEALQRELYQSSSLLSQSPGSVVYDGLPLGSISDQASRENAKRELGLPLEKAIVLFAGQIIERKGVADILHAWQMLNSTWQRSAELIIVGEDLEKRGAYRQAMEALAKQLGCNSRFMGFQRNVPTWLTAADIVLVPSHSEHLGNAVLEAMAHARPVISSTAGGLPEMTLDRVTGILVPAASPSDLAREPACRPGVAGTAWSGRAEALRGILQHGRTCCGSA